MTSPQRLLVTGALGFQGLHLVKAWALDGREVTLLNTPSARARRVAELLSGVGLPSACQVRLVYGSVNDLEILEKTLPGHDAVIHLAAWASVDVSLDRPWPPFEINAQGTYALLDGIRRFIPEARVVVASSCEVYGPAAPGYRQTDWLPTTLDPGDPPSGLIPQNEDTPMLPRSPYAATKIAADRFAYAFAVTYGLRLSILRPCNVFGPYQRHGAAGAVIPSFTRAALRGEDLVITGGGQQVREFLHVADLVAAYRLILDTEPATLGEAYNVGSGETRTVSQLAEAIRTGLASESPIRKGLARVADVSGFLLDSAAFRTRFSWKPELSFEDGLAQYLAWAQTEEAHAWFQ